MVGVIGATYVRRAGGSAVRLLLHVGQIVDQVVCELVLHGAATGKASTVFCCTVDTLLHGAAGGVEDAGLKEGIAVGAKLCEVATCRLVLAEKSALGHGVDVGDDHDDISVHLAGLVVDRANTSREICKSDPESTVTVTLIHSPTAASTE